MNIPSQVKIAFKDGAGEFSGAVNFFDDEAEVLIMMLFNVAELMPELLIKEEKSVIDVISKALG